MSGFAQLRILGQAAHSYIIADSPNGIILVDQHAAHERVLYEQLQSQRATGEVAVQQIEPALILELSADMQDQLLQQRTILAGWGFLLEDFGMVLRVRAIPAGLASERVALVLSSIAEQIGAEPSSNPASWDTVLLATIACNMAIRAGQVLNYSEMQALLSDLSRCSTPQTCPHGCPTMIVLGLGQIERAFGIR